MVNQWPVGFGSGSGSGSGNTLSSEVCTSDEHAVEPIPSKEPSTEAIGLARLLNERIVGNNPRARIRDKQERQWAVEADRMISLDNRTAAEIREVIEFSQSDTFWLTNVLSMGAVRKKFDTLWLKRNGAAKPAPVPMRPKRRFELTAGGRRAYETYGVNV
jgi:hypothetical protein